VGFAGFVGSKFERNVTKFAWRGTLKTMPTPPSLGFGPEIPLRTNFDGLPSSFSFIASAVSRDTAWVSVRESPSRGAAVLIQGGSSALATRVKRAHGTRHADPQAEKLQRASKAAECGLDVTVRCKGSSLDYWKGVRRGGALTVCIFTPAAREHTAMVSMPLHTQEPQIYKEFFLSQNSSKQLRDTLDVAPRAMQAKRNNECSGIIVPTTHPTVGAPRGVGG